MAIARSALSKTLESLMRSDVPGLAGEWAPETLSRASGVELGRLRAYATWGPGASSETRLTEDEIGKLAAVLEPSFDKLWAMQHPSDEAITGDPAKDEGTHPTEDDVVQGLGSADVQGFPASCQGACGVIVIGVLVIVITVVALIVL